VRLRAFESREVFRSYLNSLLRWHAQTLLELMIRPAQLKARLELRSAYGGNVVRRDEVGALSEAQHHDIVDWIESRGGRHLSADRPLIGTTC
jgi:hypothetical protein